MFNETELKQHLHLFLQDAYIEYDGNKEAVNIIQEYVKNGTISETQEITLKNQFVDSLKTIGVVVPFALVPGASILMPILIKVAGEHQINLLPKEFDNL